MCRVREIDFFAKLKIYFRRNDEDEDNIEIVPTPERCMYRRQHRGLKGRSMRLICNSCKPRA